jgi:flagellin
MAQTINTNIASLNAQRNLSASQSALATSMQRLSSGLRVNSAKDDAAGLAIAERMNTQVRGLNVAARNANDGISLAQTAEGALGKIGDMLQRIRELAVQSANATNNVTDRAALQAEVAQLKDEIQRVAITTSFNDTPLLDGAFTAQTFQVGANAGETIVLSGIVNAKLAALGSLQTGAATETTTAASGAYTQAYSDTATDAYQFKIDTFVVSDRAVSGATAANLDADLDAWLASSAGAGYTKTGSIVGGNLVLSKTDGSDLVVATSFSNAVGSTAAAAGPTSAGTFATGGFVGTANNGVEATSEPGIANLTITDAEKATFALSAIDTALTAVNEARGTLGAVQSRFENAIANTQVTAENLAAARGRIMDADFAAETANMSRAQILQQAGTAMVAQANQLPQQVLQLLQR